MRKKWTAAILSAALCFSLVTAVRPIEADAAALRITNTKTYVGNLNMAPALIQPLTSASLLEEYADYEQNLRPSNVIVEIDPALNVLGADGAQIGSLTEVYETVKAEGMLSVVRVDDAAEGEAFSAWLAEKDVFDIAVLSDDAALVKSVRTARSNIRGIVDYSGKAADSLYEWVKEANEAYANVIMLSQSQADAETVEYLHARFKAVWVTEDEFSELNVYSLVSSGAYGIVTDGDTREIYKFYDNYKSNSLARSFLTIGHRGVGRGYPENSLEGYKAAYESGASAIEIDMKVSADNQIFILHDSNLEERTTGSGTAENYTLAQLKNFKVTKASDGSETGMAADIPTLDDVFGYFKDKEDFVIVCEIKTVKTNVVKLFAEKVKEYGMEDKVVAIAFSMNMLELMKNTEGASGIPTASLNTIYQSSAAEDLQTLCRNNTIVNAKNDHIYFEERNLKNRGFLLYSWTYETAEIARSAISNGVLGVTTDAVTAFADYQKRILPKGEYSAAEGTEFSSATFKADVLKYDGTVEERELGVFKYAVKGDFAEAILQSVSDGYILYSEPIKIQIEKAEKPVDPPDSGSDAPSSSSGNASASSAPSAEAQGGCNSSAGGMCALLVLSGGALAIVRKRK